MRNDVILQLSDLLEGHAQQYMRPKSFQNDTTLPTEEETVAALVAAAFGLARTPEGYAAFATAVKGATIMMDRVNIPHDGHYLELEAMFQRKHGHPSPTEEARLIRETGGLPGWTQAQAEQRFKDHPEEREYIRFPAGYAIPPQEKLQ